MIHFKNVSKKFKVDFWDKPFFALEDLSFKVDDNKITGFLGSNGAGKTTSIKILFDLIRPTSGSVEFDGELANRGSNLFKEIGYFAERPYFYPYLKGSEFLRYCGYLNDTADRDIVERMNYWGKYLKIDHALDRKIKTYSKGMLQRLGLIATIIHDPKFLVLDEPMAGLDPIGRHEFKETFKLLSQNGKTIFFSSHIVSDIEEICSDVVVIEKGKLVYNGELDKLLGDDTDFEISYRTKSGEIKSEIIGSKEKDGKIESIQSNDGSILKLVSRKKHLEEIVYKIQG